VLYTQRICGTAFAATPIRFGVFEVDLIAGELRKVGLRLSFRTSRFRILALLPGTPGEVVTRSGYAKRYGHETPLWNRHSINARSR